MFPVDNLAHGALCPDAGKVISRAPSTGTPAPVVRLNSGHMVSSTRVQLGTAGVIPSGGPSACMLMKPHHNAGGSVSVGSCVSNIPSIQTVASSCSSGGVSYPFVHSPQASPISQGRSLRPAPHLPMSPSPSPHRSLGMPKSPAPFDSPQVSQSRKSSIGPAASARTAGGSFVIRASPSPFMPSRVTQAESVPPSPSDPAPIMRDAPHRGNHHENAFQRVAGASSEEMESMRSEVYEVQKSVAHVASKLNSLFEREDCNARWPNESGLHALELRIAEQSANHIENSMTKAADVLAADVAEAMKAVERTLRAEMVTMVQSLVPKEEENHISVDKLLVHAVIADIEDRFSKERDRFNRDMNQLRKDLVSQMRATGGSYETNSAPAGVDMVVLRKNRNERLAQDLQEVVKALDKRVSAMECSFATLHADAKCLETKVFDRSATEAAGDASTITDHGHEPRALSDQLRRDSEIFKGLSLSLGGATTKFEASLSDRSDLSFDDIAVAAWKEAKVPLQTSMKSFAQQRQGRRSAARRDRSCSNDAPRCRQLLEEEFKQFDEACASKNMQRAGKPYSHSRLRSIAAGLISSTLQVDAGAEHLENEPCSPYLPFQCSGGMRQPRLTLAAIKQPGEHDFMSTDAKMSLKGGSHEDVANAPPSDSSTADAGSSE